MKIDGKAIALEIRRGIKAEIKQLVQEGRRAPGLAVILVGEDPASMVYVANKEKACKNAGIYSETLRLPADTEQDRLLSIIAELNGRDDIDGILVQLPLPRQIDESAVLRAISPKKDVDGFHIENAGAMFTGMPALLPGTPSGVIELLHHENIEIEGKHAVVLGRSNIVGKPLAMLLLAENATVTVCHSRTKNLADITRQADILCVAIGKPKFVTADMVKPGAVVIDVGVNRLESGLCGDTDYEAIEPIASAITPVPGGVGPMTIAMLIKNTLAAYRMREGI